MTDDPRLAALAEALRTLPVPSTCEEWQAAVDRSYEEDAAAILAALPPDWCGHWEIAFHSTERAEQNASLREETTRAWAIVDAQEVTIARLREALDEIERTTREEDTQAIARAALAGGSE